jgi:hypothetical protein
MLCPRSDERAQGIVRGWANPQTGSHLPGKGADLFRKEGETYAVTIFRIKYSIYGVVGQQRSAEHHL